MGDVLSGAECEAIRLPRATFDFHRFETNFLSLNEDLAFGYGGRKSKHYGSIEKCETLWDEEGESKWEVQN